MTHSYVWYDAKYEGIMLRHDSFIYVTWLIHMCDMTQNMKELCCDMTHSYMWHDSFIYVTWLIHMCDMTQNMQELCCQYERATAHIWTSHVTHVNSNGAFAKHFQNVSKSCRKYERVMDKYVCKIWMSHVANMKEPRHTYEWDMSHVWLSHATHMKKSCHTYERVV